jgi:hypothetical protein
MHQNSYTVQNTRQWPREELLTGTHETNDRTYLTEHRYWAHDRGWVWNSWQRPCAELITISATHLHSPLTRGLAAWVGAAMSSILLVEPTSLHLSLQSYSISRKSQKISLWLFLLKSFENIWFSGMAWNYGLIYLNCFSNCLYKHICILKHVKFIRKAKIYFAYADLSDLLPDLWFQQDIFP